MAAKKPGKKMQTHVDRTPVAYTGTLKIDVSTLAAVLFDLAKGARKGMRGARTGVDDVALELGAATQADFAAAGIPPALYQGFVTDHGNVNQLSQAGPAVIKLAEVLEESLAISADAREHKLAKMAAAIRSSAQHDKNEGVKAPFQKLLAYVGEIAQKGAKTKAEKKAAQTPPATGGTPPAAAGH